MDRPRLVLTGSSGFLGRLLTRYFTEQDWQVTTISRSNAFHVWDARTLGPWTEALENATAVVNLAGRSVNCRYHSRNKALIYASRLDSTHILGQAIASAKRPPKVWLNSSTATIYRHAEDRPMDEHTGELGFGFSVDVATQWERVFFEAPAPPSVRRVALRTAMVMDAEPGGAFQPFANLARLGLGGRLASGNQRISWIHGYDFCRAVHFLIQHNLAGAVNLSAPNPLPQRDFARELRRALAPGFGLPATRWMLEAGAFLLRTETELLLKSRWVLPRRLLEAGFEFAYPTWPQALDAILSGHTERPRPRLHRTQQTA